MGLEDEERMMSERFIHYSAKPLTEVRSVKQESYSEMKPRGLWFSVDDPSLDEPMGWREWCEAENFSIPSLELQTEIAFKPDARVLRLSNADDIDRFHRKYKQSLSRRYTYFQINWARVAEKYQAIIIAPYIWQRRLDREVRWYYGWDCASGCVWDASAVAQLASAATAHEAA
jgi:hypothetical protein